LTNYGRGALVVFDGEANRACHRRNEVTPSQILGGNVANPRNNVIDIVLRA
jgi:lipid-binding SYLF domain-containing protein